MAMLLKQLPPGTEFPAASRTVLVHPPPEVKTSPVRQGPFLQQPAPLTLEGCECGDATDIVYLSFGADESEEENEPGQLGVMLVVYQEGKVDVLFDLDKVEPQWQRKVCLIKLPKRACFDTSTAYVKELSSTVNI